MECLNAEFAAPRSFRRLLDLGHDAVHVVAAVAVVAEQKLNRKKNKKKIMLNRKKIEIKKRFNKTKKLKLAQNLKVKKLETNF